MTVRALSGLLRSSLSHPALGRQEVIALSVHPRLLTVAIGVLVVFAACGSDGATTGSTASPGTATPQAPAAPAEPTVAPAPVQPAPGQPDPSTVDWATVDLSTIDWATVDMSQVDWQGVSDNPTARNLDGDTLRLITSRTNPGSATLTIGDETWEFDNFVCAFGHEATESDTFSFTTDSRGEFDGVRVQMQVTIADDSGQGRFEGEGTSQRISFNDVSDFENPSIDWSMPREAGAISIDGYEVTAEGLFEDQLMPLGDREGVPGTLEATCGDMSRR